MEQSFNLKDNKVEFAVMIGKVSGEIFLPEKTGLNFNI